VPVACRKRYFVDWRALVNPGQTEEHSVVSMTEPKKARWAEKLDDVLWPAAAYVRGEEPMVRTAVGPCSTVAANEAVVEAVETSGAETAVAIAGLAGKGRTALRQSQPDELQTEQELQV